MEGKTTSKISSETATSSNLTNHRTSQIDFEAKLSADLSFSQKFCDEYSFQKHPFDLSTRNYLQDLHRIEIRSYPNRQRIWYRTTFKTKHGKIELIHRFGGPSSYELRDDRIARLEYHVAGKKLAAGEYWLLYCQLPHFSTEKIGNIVYYSCLDGKSPCPFSYDLETKRFVWKLGGRRATASSFWKYWEQKFIHLKDQGAIEIAENLFPPDSSSIHKILNLIGHD